MNLGIHQLVRDVSWYLGSENLFILLSGIRRNRISQVSEDL